MEALRLGMQSLTATARSSVSAQQRPVTSASGGKDMPSAGNARPLGAAASAEQLVSIENAIAQIQDYLASSQRELEFVVDDATGRTVIMVYDSNGELVRRFPSEELLQMAASIRAQGFNFIDQLA